MKCKILLLALLFSCVLKLGYAQITGPATVTAGTPATFSGPPGHRSYTWNNGVSAPLQIDLNTSIPRTQTTTLNGAQDVAVLYDHDLAQWYAFGFGWTALALHRANLGANPTQSAGAMTAVPGTAFTGTDRAFGITFYHDDATGKWHCFMAITGTGSAPVRIRRFDFDNLAATPTETAITLPPQISTASLQPYEIVVVKENGEYMLFLSNYWGAPYRIDLGSSIVNSTPSFGAQLTAPGVNSTTGMAFHKQAGVWYALLVGVNNSLMRYTFTNGIKDPAPSVSQVGSNLLVGSDKYRIRLVTGDCGDQLLAFVTGPESRLSRLDFNGDITSTPAAPTGVQTPNFPSQLNQGLYPYVYDNQLHMAVGIFGSNGIFNMKISDLPAGTRHVYNDPDVSLTFPAPGTYDVHLVVDMDGDVPTAAYCHTVTVTAPSGPARPGTYTVAPRQVCVGQSNVTYSVPDVSGAAEYHWWYSGANVNYAASTTQPVNSLSFQANATDGVLHVWAVNSNGDSSTSSRDSAIIANTLPNVDISPATVTICSGQSATLTATGANAYIWSPSGGNAVAATVSPASTSVYTVEGTSTATGCKNTATRTVTVNALPNVGISPATVGICPGESVQLTASGADTYSWLPSGGSGATATVSPGGTTGYTVEGTNAATGCKNTANRQVVVNSLPVTQITVVGAITDVCVGDSVVLNASGAGYNYQWKQGGVVSGNGNRHVARASGSYKVIATDQSSGCVDSTQVVDVRVFDRPVVSLDHMDTAFCDGGVIRLEVSTQDTGLTYVWQRDGSAISQAVADFLEISETGAYKVLVERRVIRMCGDSTNEVAVTVYDLPAVNITWDNEVLHATPGYESYQWYLGDQGLSGETDSVFTPSSNAGYRVVVLDSNGCEGKSPIQNLTNVSVDGLAQSGGVKVYPNPSDGIIYIQSPAGVNVELLGMDGRLLQYIVNARELNLHGYASGVYLLRMLNVDGLVVGMERIVKQ